MSSVFAILLVVIVNLMPVGTKTFTIEMPDGRTPGTKTVQFTRQADGWHAVDLPKDDLGIFEVKGTELTAKSDGKEFTQDLGKLLGIDANTDWSTVKELKFGGVPMKVERVADGVDFVLAGKDHEGKEIQRVFKARWAAPKK